MEMETISSFQKEKICFHNRQLSSSTLLIISKNNSFLNIKKKIEQIIRQKPRKFKEFNKLIHEIDNDLESSKHLENFKKHFAKVHTGFFDKLKSIHSNLNGKDMFFCAFLRINLNTYELSQLLNIQSGSVKMTKIRLKKKLELLPEINLDKYILQI
jgi:hypothetical protein